MKMAFTEVSLVPRSIDRWRDICSAERWNGLEETLRLGRLVGTGRPFWCINSTAVGGGVAEMLRTMLSYLIGVGIDAHWGVIGGDTEFFTITKRLHNFVHGHPGDGGPLSWQERNAYHRTMQANIDDVLKNIAPRSLVILHDPQTAGLVDPLQRHGCTVVWRCHIGTERPNEFSAAAWSFIEPFVSDADRLVFSRSLHVPNVLSSGPVAIVSPSIDPFAPKNQRLDDERIHAILTTTGLLPSNGVKTTDPIFYRLSGETARVSTKAVVFSGSTLNPDHPLVLQVSRWDKLKDHLGVMRGFVAHTLENTDADLLLIGPHVEAVTDDPEGADVLAAVVAEHGALPDLLRSRVHIASLPTTDVEENAVVVNALQRYATVVLQKSLEEGFGLTVTEALWKGKPMIASRVGGICDQIDDGESGVLLDDPTDIDAFGKTLTDLLLDEDRLSKLGIAAKDKAHSKFLHDHHIRRWLRLFAILGRRR